MRKVTILDKSTLTTNDDKTIQEEDTFTLNYY